MVKHTNLPKTVDQAVDLLIAELSFGDRTIIANMKQEDLENLDFAIGVRVRGEFGLENGNKKLLQSCCSESGLSTLDPNSAVAFIIEKLWRSVQNTPVLKIIK